MWNNPPAVTYLKLKNNVNRIGCILFRLYPWIHDNLYYLKFGSGQLITTRLWYYTGTSCLGTAYVRQGHNDSHKNKAGSLLREIHKTWYGSGAVISWFAHLFPSNPIHLTALPSFRWRIALRDAAYQQWFELFSWTHIYHTCKAQLVPHSCTFVTISKVFTARRLEHEFKVLLLHT